MSDLSNDYILKSVRVEPEKIEVSGNIDIIGNMTYLATENISLAEMTQPTKKTVKLLITRWSYGFYSRSYCYCRYNEKDTDTTSHTVTKETDNTKN